ncbi:hypothetical protein ES703_82687 [subsurface metagenome]
MNEYEECISRRFQKHYLEAVKKLNTTLATDMTSMAEKINLYVRKQLLNDKNIETWLRDAAPTFFEGIKGAFEEILKLLEDTYKECQKECNNISSV